MNAAKSVEKIKRLQAAFHKELAAKLLELQPTIDELDALHAKLKK